MDLTCVGVLLQVWGLYFLLDEIEHEFYNFAKENIHDKNDRFA